MIGGAQGVPAIMAGITPAQIATIPVSPHIVQYPPQLQYGKLDSSKESVVVSSDTLQKHKWENAMTIDRYSWGFRREATIDQYLSIEEIVAQLVITVRSVWLVLHHYDVVVYVTYSCGGNMLMNVGPTHDGRVAPILQERLEQMGEW